MIYYYKPAEIFQYDQFRQAMLDLIPVERRLQGDLYYPPKVDFLRVLPFYYAMKKLDLLQHVSSVAVVVIPPGKELPIHHDTGSPVYSLNIPIEHCEGTYTKFYTSTKEPELIPGIMYRYDPECCTEVDRVYMDAPHVINVHQAHSAHNTGSNIRLLVAVRLLPSFDINQSLMLT